MPAAPCSPELPRLHPSTTEQALVQAQAGDPSNAPAVARRNRSSQRRWKGTCPVSDHHVVLHLSCRNGLMDASPSTTSTPTSTTSETTTTTEPSTATTAEATTTAPPSSTSTTPVALYANCDEARAAGAAPLITGDAGYSSALDPDGDGIACEIDTRSTPEAPSTPYAPSTPRLSRQHLRDWWAAGPPITGVVQRHVLQVPRLFIAGSPGTRRSLTVTETESPASRPFGNFGGCCVPPG